MAPCSTWHCLLTPVSAVLICYNEKGLLAPDMAEHAHEPGVWSCAICLTEQSPQEVSSSG